jgi:hypothetical protein
MVEAAGVEPAVYLIFCNNINMLKYFPTTFLQHIMMLISDNNIVIGAQKYCRSMELLMEEKRYEFWYAYEYALLTRA